MGWTDTEEKQVSRMTRYQVGQMTLKQLWIAATFEKFQVSDLIEQAQKVSEGEQLQAFINHINSFEDEIGRTGSWYKAAPTIKW